jgi:hypothetical protein
MKLWTFKVGLQPLSAGPGFGSVGIRVDNDNHFASFFAKTLLQTLIVFLEKIMRSPQ